MGRALVEVGRFLMTMGIIIIVLPIVAFLLFIVWSILTADNRWEAGCGKPEGVCVERAESDGQ